MTTKPSSDAPEPEGTEPAPAPSGVVTRADLKAEQKPEGPTESVTLTSPKGAKVTTAASAGDMLRKLGYK